MKETLINDNLLEEIRTSRNTSKWHNSNDNKIVDFGYTHEYLLAYRTVDDIIKKFYQKSFKEIYTTEEWHELTKLAKQNKNSITNNSSFLIKGALHNRENLWIKIGTLLELKDKFNLNNNYKYLSDLKPYFKDYARGFKSGYNQFLNVIVKPHLVFKNKEEAAPIVFNYITNNSSNDPITTVSKDFKLKLENGEYELDYDYLDGVAEGYLYRAWQIIFSQNDLFLPIFKKYLNGENTIQLNKTKLIKDDILKMQNILIPKVSLEYVYDFFSVLIEPNKKGAFYLDPQKLLIFIKSTFVEKQPIPQDFNVKLKLDKKDIRSIFRKFQDNCYDYDYKKTKIKRKYFDIMFKGFNGFEAKSDFDKWAETNNKIPTLSKPKGKYLVGKGNF